MHKTIFIIGIISLFILSAVAPMSVGYYVKTAIRIESTTSDGGLMDSAWPMFSHDARHTGHSPYGKSGTWWKEKWETTIGGLVYSSPAIDKNGTIYIGSYDRYFYAINPNGTQKWRFKTGEGIESSPAIAADGTIFIGSNDGHLYAFYPNGTKKWSLVIGVSLVYSSPVIDEEGNIYVASVRGNNICAVYPNGTKKWDFHTGNRIYSSPALDDDTVYCGSHDGFFYAIYKNNGTLKWRFNTGNWCGGKGATIDDDGTIYVGDGDYYINAINPNGTLKWRFKTGLVVYSSPAIGDDGTVYCGSHDTYLYALYPNNGTLKWRYKTGHWIRTSPCIGDDGTIYVVSLDDYLHAVSPNGTYKWKTNVGAGTSPTIGQDGSIYCGWDRLHAVNPIDGLIKWSFNPGTDRVIEGGTPCNSADGTIYFGANIGEISGGEIIAINSDGTENWRKKICDLGWVDFAPVIDEDGTVYIGSSTKEYVRPGAVRSFGYLYAFNEIDPDAPSTPKIIGPTKVNSKKEIDYTFKSTSPLGNNVFYYVDWGDGDWEIDWWLGPYGSGEGAVISHTWSEPGTYTIRSRCKDSDNLWSDWSEFKVTIPRNRANIGSNWLRLLEAFPLLKEVILRLIR